MSQPFFVSRLFREKTDCKMNHVSLYACIICFQNSDNNVSNLQHAVLHDGSYKCRYIVADHGDADDYKYPYRNHQADNMTPESL